MDDHGEPWWQVLDTDRRWFTVLGCNQAGSGGSHFVVARGMEMNRIELSMLF